MAQQPQISAKKEVKTSITDSNGNIIVEIGQQEYTLKTSSGELIHRAISESMQLVDGTIWSPLSKLYVGVCEQCRTLSKNHGIVAMHTAKLCVDCGTLCCPRHRKLSDNQWRCIRCARKFKFKKLIRPLFFKEQS
jgi:hypothetical protein